MQFHLINTTILLLSREGFRRACLRVDHASDPGATAKVLGAGLLTVPLGGLLAGGLTAVLLRASAAKPPDYRAALVMQGEGGGGGKCKLCVGVVGVWGVCVGR